MADLASRVEMDVARDRARLVQELIRRVYSPPPTRPVPLRLVVGAREEIRGAPVLVDAPLTPEIWSAAVFRVPVPADRLLATILSDRRAALLCRGLLGADDDTLAFYAEHPALLAFLYERAAGAFAAFGPSLQIRRGRLAVPGGSSAEPLWEAALGARVDDPEAFIRALFFEPEARPAYVYDSLGAANPGARAFALGLWIDDETLRVRRFQALHMAARRAYREWHVSELPFARPLNDLPILLLRIRTGARGVPAQPALRRFWTEVLEARDPVDPAVDLVPPSHTLVDAAWLVQAIAGDMYARGDRLDQFAFGQRVFGGRADADSDAVAAVLREMTTRRMLLLSLERLGITNPEVYGSALRQARAAADGGGDRFWTLAQLQGALAVIVRMHVNGALSTPAAETLVRTLSTVPLTRGELRGALVDWFESSLAPRLTRASTWQARVVAGAAGGPTPGDPEVEWEGQIYRLDLAAAERRRIEEIQSHQDGPDLDAAFAIAKLGRRAMQATSLDEGPSLVAGAQQAVAAYGLALARPPTNVLAPGVAIPRDGREWLGRTAEELERGTRTGDLRRITRAGESLVELGDVVLGHAMLSLVYAIHLGDPGGPALLGGNVALRHDFGFGRRDGQGRSRGPWALPRQDFQPGVPWHVVGSLVGLDIGLAPLSMRRLSMESLPAPPRLQSIEREAFAINVALLNARQLTDRDRDRIVAGIRKGRGRVRALPGSTDGLGAVERELGLDGWRGRIVRWVLQNDPDSVENQFSLAELLVLGEPDAALDGWGASGLLPYGCACTRFPGPRTWRILSGRTQMPMMAAATAEMNLEMAERLATLQLPAALLPAILATAMQDYVDRVETADPGDRDPLLTYPRRIGRDTLADHIAATATLDGPLISAELEATEP